MTNVSPASGPSPGAGASPVSSSVSPAAARSSTSSALARDREPRRDRLGDDRPDALDLRDLVRARRRAGPSSERKWCAIASAVTTPTCGMPRPNSTRPNGRCRDASIEAIDVLRRALLEAVELEQLLGRQRVEIGRAAHEPELPEARHQLLAHAVDVERAARDEVAQALEAAARAVRVDAAVHGLALEAHDLAAAGRAVVGHAELALAAVAPRQHGPDHLRDHVAGALRRSRVADADVLELDVVLVVQRRERTITPPTATGSSTANGFSAPVRPTLMPMSSSRVIGRRRRELERDRPARVAPDRAERLLLVAAVDLDDAAVDVVVELAAQLDEALAGLGHALDRLVAARQRVDREALLPQPLEPLQCELELDALERADAVA